jgi:hypothetical protein
MASLSVTISNGLNLFGIAPSDKWGVYNWAAFTWGEGTADLPILFTKFLDNSLAATSDLGKNTTKFIDNSFAADADMYSEKLQDGVGYYYVFPNNVTELESRNETSYSLSVASTQSWSTLAATSISWS